MLFYIIELLNRFKESFNSSNKQVYNELEQYILSKNPSNPAEVDYWIRQYENNNKKDSWI